MKLTFIIKNENSGSARDSWCVLPFTAKPGMNEYKLPVDALKSQAGKPFTLEKIKQWDFGWKFFPEKDWEENDKSDALTVYVSRLRLED